MKQQLSQNWKFHIPDLKVGTLDQLVGLSDDLGKKFLNLFYIHIRANLLIPRITQITFNLFFINDRQSRFIC